ncbi:MAG: N-6 DNA methylase [Candidatus Lokiarchaeota archaeon]|nr:N-6 DNA methylase [Candidatus Lokiarchaeota archaeon]
MIKESLEIYIRDFFKSKINISKNFTFDKLDELFVKIPRFKSIIIEKLNNLKILDPACGSGRFLLGLVELLFNLYRLVDSSSDNFTLKKKIIKNNIYGIDSDEEACFISKLRLFRWLYSESEASEWDNNNLFILEKKNDLKNLRKLFNSINFRFNIKNQDFLLDNQPPGKYDIIIGNPPYIENKKIINLEYKKKLYANFQSAYKLFDLSILFIERSLNILKNSGFISFLITNKFLSSDYGIKLRKLLIVQSKIKLIINISSLPIFLRKSIYPIIIFIQNKIPKEKHMIKIKNIENLENLENYTEFKMFLQRKFLEFPGKVIPLKGDIEFIHKIYLTYKSMDEKFNNLKIVYRPYGFTDYTKYFNYINKIKQTEYDLILIGTGNVGKYHIKFNKKIKIAKGNYSVSYINPENKNQNIWSKICTNKIIFREIAKELTCVYDPGVFTNITGLYFIEIPNLEVDSLFALLCILNSKFIDDIFKTLFGTLHMAGGYLRFNGSFIKKLPMPHCFPLILARLGKLTQFLQQLNYDYFNHENYFNFFSQSKIKLLLDFLNPLSEALIRVLYISGMVGNSNNLFQELNILLNLKNTFFDIELKFSYPYFNLDLYNTTSNQEQEIIILKIEKIICNLKKNKELLEEIKKINNQINFIFKN